MTASMTPFGADFSCKREKGFAPPRAASALKGALRPLREVGIT
jgi:hypothetical protein